METTRVTRHEVLIAGLPFVAVVTTEAGLLGFDGPGSVTTTNYERLPYDTQMVTEARGWLADCFEDLPEDLTDAEVVTGVRRHYVGGWPQFVADSA